MTDNLIEIIVYFLIAIGILLFNLMIKKKKPPIAKNSAVPKETEQDIFDVLEKELKSEFFPEISQTGSQFEDNDNKPVWAKEGEPTTISEKEILPPNAVQEKILDRIDQSVELGYKEVESIDTVSPEKEGVAVTFNEKDLTKKFEIQDKMEEEKPIDFDIRKAVIYAEILRRPEF